MRIVRWVMFVLGFLIGSSVGRAARSESAVDDLSVLPPPSVSDDPHELSGWVGMGGLRHRANEHATASQDEWSGCSSCGDAGWLRPSDHRFDCFISPMTNPVFFEDPRTLTEARVIFMNQSLPVRGPLTGGDFQFLGVQARAAITERFSVVMTKSGFFMAGDPTPVDDGWADVSLGLKYNFYADPDAQQIITAGLNYEIPLGSDRALQGNGAGEYNLYVTGAAAVGEFSHLVSALGWRMPGNTDAESQVMYWSSHWDTRITNGGLYFLAEANWYHYLNSGAAAPLDFEGLDLFNLGSADVAGNDIVTGAAGFKLKRSPHREIGVAYEVPLTDRRDMLNDRITVDFILRY